MITIGIDPGWASFGIALTAGEGQLIAKTSFIPKEYINIAKFISVVEEWIRSTIEGTGESFDGFKVYIERFVTYGGVQTDPENVLMLIGALDYYFSRYYSKPILVRALDWKVKLCHHLVKTKGISNPGKNFDKKYSLWAAEQLTGEKFKSDHEADAVCISYLNEEILNGDKRK